MKTKELKQARDFFLRYLEENNKEIKLSPANWYDIFTVMCKYKALTIPVVVDWVTVESNIPPEIMSDIDKIKILIDYTNYIKECVSSMPEINKNTIRNYLKEDYYYEKRI